MKVVQINCLCGSGSTGKICVGISKELNKKDIENYVLYTQGNSSYENSIRCINPFSKFNAIQSRILGNYGFNSDYVTKKIIKQIEIIKPDIVHLHNLHSHNCNIAILFDYLNESKIKIVWTFHDCWAFTGYCPHYAMIKCDKWKNQCNQCEVFRKYSWFFDRCNEMFKFKKSRFIDSNMTIVTPSKWMKKQVANSFLKYKEVHVINNGINLSVFKPTDSNFREKYSITSDKFVILGVAFEWSVNKGIDVFFNLAKQLNPLLFQIVLVGNINSFFSEIPNNIIKIDRIADQKELASIYTASNLFVNPTREENFPTVNIEALACGTPVLTFNTGGSPEIINRSTGLVVENELDLYDAIIEIQKNNTFFSSDCVKRAYDFAEESRFNDYVALYEKIIANNY